MLVGCQLSDDGSSSLRDTPSAWPSCEIELTLSVRVEDAELGPTGATPWVTSNGSRIYVIDIGNQSTIQIFDANTGDFVEEIGRRGQGPDEYMHLEGILAVDDTVFLFDGGNSRLAVLNDALQPVRTARVAVSPSPLQPLTWVEGIGLLAIGWSPTPQGAGLPLHLLASDGSIVRSFGASLNEPAGGSGTFSAWRVASPTSGPLVWTSRVNRYLIERWDVRDGSLAKRILIDAPWLDDAFERGVPVVQRPPMILSLYEDADGLLWVLVRLNVSDTRSPPRHGEGREGDLTDFWDLRLDVVDPTTGSIIASHQVPDYAGGLMNNRQLVSFEASNNYGQMSVYDTDLFCSAPRPSRSPRGGT